MRYNEAMEKQEGIQVKILSEDEKVSSGAFGGKKEVKNVNYFGNPDEWRTEGLRVARDVSTVISIPLYLLSPVDSSDKLSEGYANCSGILVSAKNKKSGDWNA